MYVNDKIKDVPGLIGWFSNEALGDVGTVCTNWENRAGGKLKLSSNNNNIMIEEKNGVKGIRFSKEKQTRMDFNDNFLMSTPDTTVFIEFESFSSGHIFGYSTSSTPYLPYLTGIYSGGNEIITSQLSNNAGIGNLSTKISPKNNFIGVVFSKNAIFVREGQNLNHQEGVAHRHPYSRVTLGSSDGSAFNKYIEPWDGIIKNIIVFERALELEEFNELFNELNSNSKYMLEIDGEIGRYVIGEWKNFKLTSEDFLKNGITTLKSLNDGIVLEKYPKDYNSLVLNQVELIQLKSETDLKSTDLLYLYDPDSSTYFYQLEKEIIKSDSKPSKTDYVLEVKRDILKDNVVYKVFYNKVECELFIEYNSTNLNKIRNAEEFNVISYDAIKKDKGVIFFDYEEKYNLLLAKNDIAIKSVDNIDFFTVEYTAKNPTDIKIIVSVDEGNTWYTHDGQWSEINHQDTSEVYNYGIPVNTLGLISSKDWNELRKQSNVIRFGYLIFGEADKGTMVHALNAQFDMTGEWFSANKGTDYKYSYPDNSTIKVTILKNGDYKINY